MLLILKIIHDIFILHDTEVVICIILYWVTLGFILSTDQSVMSDESKLSTHQQLLTDWSIYLSVLHMIGQLEMNDRLHDTTSNRILLDANISPNNFF
jgi:hypothetical protein